MNHNLSNSFSKIRDLLKEDIKRPAGMQLMPQEECGCEDEMVSEEPIHEEPSPVSCPEESEPDLHHGNMEDMHNMMHGDEQSPVKKVRMIIIKSHDGEPPPPELINSIISKIQDHYSSAL